MVQRPRPVGLSAERFQVRRWWRGALTALCSGLLACSGKITTEWPDAAMAPETDGAPAGESDGPVDHAVADAADAAASDSQASGDVTAPGDATPPPRDAGADEGTISPADAGDAAMDATGPDSGTQTRDASTDATGADSGPPDMGDAAPPSSSATAVGGNPAHTGSNLVPTLAPPLAAIWSFHPGIGVSATYPLIAAGRVYFVYSTGSPQTGAELTAVDEHTGATLWGPVDLASSILPTAAYDGEQVFTVDDSGMVRAFDAATGAPSWTHALGGFTPSGGPPTAYRGLVYVIEDNALIALDEVTGQVRWTAPLDAASAQVAAAVTDDGVFVSLGCESTYAFDRATGSVLWQHLPTCSGFGSTPVAYDGRLYVVEDDGIPEHTDVYDATNGGLIGSLPCFISPAFDNGRAYCNQRTPLVAFDLTTGLQTWTFSDDSQLNLAPFAAGGTVYVASDTGMMFGVDETTGTPTWSTEADRLGASTSTVGGEGILLTSLYGGGGVVAYAHVDLPDAGVVLGDGAVPTPFPLVPNEFPYDLALDATNLYWADGSEIGLAPKSGGSPTTLWTAPSSSTPPESVAVDATNVYFVVRGDGGGTPSTIMSVPIAGGSASTLASSPSLLTGPFVAGPSQVYWVDGAIESVPKTGGTVTTVLPGVEAGALAVDATNLYWSAIDGLHKMPLAGGSDTLLGIPFDPEPELLGPVAATALAVDGANVYYAMNSLAGPGSVGYIPIAGGTPTVLASGRIGDLMAIVIDDRNVYWVEGYGTIQQGAIAAVPKTGGQVTVLVTGLSDPMAVAADGTGVYLPDLARGISKIAE
jgi:outer membrane protein assembly factor BamB